MCHPAGALPSDWLPPSLIFKIYPLCHHNSGLKLYLYLAFIDNPDCPQQSSSQLIIKLPFQVIGLSHVTFHILHPLVIGLSQLLMSFGFGALVDFQSFFFFSSLFSSAMMRYSLSNTSSADSTFALSSMSFISFF